MGNNGANERATLQHRKEGRQIAIATVTVAGSGERQGMVLVKSFREGCD